jgi:hypothetical protein
VTAPVHPLEPEIKMCEIAARHDPHHHRERAQSEPLTTWACYREPFRLLDASALWLARLGRSAVLVEAAWYVGPTNLVGRRLVKTSIWEYRND